MIQGGKVFKDSSERIWQAVTIIDENGQTENFGATYKLIEFNSNETYIKISFFDENFVLIVVQKELYFGVTLANIGTISTIIDTTKNVIQKLK